MKTYLKSLSLAAVAAGFALPAVAGGMNEPMAEPMIVQAAPVYAPSADWSGGYVGAQLGYGDVSASSGAGDNDGVIGGLHAGYLYDFGQFVAGAELDFDLMDIDLGATGDVENVARLKLIAGVDMGQTLFYATGGVARAKVGNVGGGSDTDNGYVLGLGVAYAVSDQMTVGAEILGHRFDDFAGTGIDVDATAVTARVSYRF
jgi:outer membrane immunogenic protein